MSNELYHYGVKGMHWGVRRYQPYPKGYKGSGKYVGRIGSLNQTDILRSSDGKTVMTPRKKGLIARGLAKVSPKIAKAQKNFYSYDIRDDKNNKVGYAELERQKNGKVLYGNWINVNKKHRGKGHAQRAMDMLIKEGKKDKYERFDLEVPGDSKDARHIYEKYGFKAGKKISDDDDIWGGLTKMSRPLAKKGKIGSIDNAIWLNKSKDDWNRVYYDPDTKKVMYGKQYNRSEGFKSANQIRRKEMLTFGRLPGTGRGYGKKLLKDQKRLRNVYENTKSASALKNEWNKMANEEASNIKTWEKDQRKKRSRKTIRAIKKESKILSKQYGYPVYAIYDYDNYTWRYAHSKSGRTPKLKPGEKIVR